MLSCQIKVTTKFYNFFIKDVQTLPMLKGSAILQQILRVGHQARREDDTVSGQDVITKECTLQDQKQDL